MTLWNDLGFRSNPYDSEPLTATEEGEQLLVGRNPEVRRLRSALSNSTLHPTLEGDNGVGKTSLVMVAGFRALQDYRNGVSNEMFLPMVEVLQIGTDVAEFERRALLQIAQALLSYEEFLRSAGIEPTGMADLRSWLNRPIVRGGGGGVQILGIGANAEVSAEANGGGGFEASGLESLVRGILNEAFPTREAGGLIAVIDNMELLLTSNEAKRVLERIRDTTLSLPGVRWVLCGAKGIVRASVSTARLTGRVGIPIEVGPVPNEMIEELLTARLHHFAARPDYHALVGPAEFRHLYEVSNQNLRDALRYAQEFSIWVDLQDLRETPRADLIRLLEAWIAEEADKINSSIRLQPRQWTLFDDLASAGGTCAPGDFEAFGFASMARMRTNFAELERADLIVAEIDEHDHRRRTVNFTSKAWIVHYARSGFSSGAHTQAV